MRAVLKQEGPISIISISGSIDIGRAQALREHVKKELLKEPLIFNLQEARFVGSNGIQTLINTFKLVSEASTHSVGLVGVQVELKRLLGGLEIPNLSFFETEQEAVASHANRSKPA